MVDGTAVSREKIQRLAFADEIELPQAGLTSSHRETTCS